MPDKFTPKQMHPLSIPGQRFIHPSSVMPTPMDVGRWRLIAQEPVNRLARKMIQREVASLNWKVTPLDPQNEEHQTAALYYTQIFKNFRGLITRTLKSVCEIPQGGAWETGWITPALFDEGNKGTLSFVKFIDGGTLWPTPSNVFPIVQVDPKNTMRTVSFRPDEIHRILAYPRDEFDRTWWQESPTESSYLAIEALARIYTYYLKQLGDTPVAGILDLMDFGQESATAWAKDFREMLVGIDPIKIPILYEHEEPAKWLPMGRNPSELDIPMQFQRFAEMVLSNYGLSLSDLRMFDIGSTKAAAAVSRKISTQSGIGFFAELIKDAVQELLPPFLIFGYSDVDIEQERTKAQIRAADSRTVMSLEGFPLHLKLEQLKKWGVLDIEFDPKAVEKEAEDKVGAGVGLASGGSKQPGQLETGEGKRRDVLEDDAKENAAGGTRIFAKSAEKTAKGITGEIGGAVAKFKQNFSMSKLGRKKAKAAKAMERLMDKEFRRIGKGITPVLIKGFQDKILTQVPEILLTVIQEPMEAKAAVWDEMLTQFSRNNYDFQREKLDDVRLRIEVLLDALLDDAEFYLLDEPAIIEEILRIYGLAYEDGLLGAAELVQTGLFNRQLRDKPIITRSFSLVNSEVLNFLETKALETISNIDSGTKFFLKRMLTEGVMQGMGVDVLTDEIQSQLFGLPEEEAGKLNRNRIRSIVTTEINRAESLGRLGQMEAIGLRLKVWITRKIDVCPVCIANELLGSVPLDFLFKDVFGDTLGPPGHPVTCHCSIGADAEELETLDDVNFWFGGEKPRQKADVIEGEFYVKDVSTLGTTSVPDTTIRQEVVFADPLEKAHKNGKKRKKKKKTKSKKEATHKREKFNPYHKPAGTPDGGQFTTVQDVGLPGRPRSRLGDVRTGVVSSPKPAILGAPSGQKFKGKTEVASINLPNGGQIPIFATTKAKTVLNTSEEGMDGHLQDIEKVLATIDPRHLEGIEEVKFVARSATSMGGSWQGKIEVIDRLPDGKTTYQVTTSIIKINTTKLSINEERIGQSRGLLRTGSVLKHEVGHNLWHVHLTGDQRARFGELVGHAGSSSWRRPVTASTFNSWRRARVDDISKYGTSNVTESFSEAYTGVDSLLNVVSMDEFFTLRSGQIKELGPRKFEDAVGVLGEISQW